MTPDELQIKLFDILHAVAPEVDLSKIGPDETLREALDIDSFDFLKVVIAIHKTFGVEIPESDYRHIGTLGGLTKYLDRFVA